MHQFIGIPFYNTNDIRSTMYPQQYYPRQYFLNRIRDFQDLDEIEELRHFFYNPFITQRQQQLERENLLKLKIIQQQEEMRKREEKGRIIEERRRIEERRKYLEEKRKAEARKRIIEEIKRNQERRKIIEEVRRIDEEIKKRNEEIMRSDEEYARALQEEEYEKLKISDANIDKNINWKVQTSHDSQICIEKEIEKELPPIIIPESSKDNSQSADSNDLLKFDDYPDP